VHKNYRGVLRHQVSVANSLQYRERSYSGKPSLCRWLLLLRRKEVAKPKSSGIDHIWAENCEKMSFPINPKGRVPRALSVGECKGGDMVCLEHGSASIWP